MSVWQSAKDFLSGKFLNKFNKSFYWNGVKFTNNDDNDLEKYVNKGYNVNSDVFSVINQISSKFVSIPYSIKKIEDNTNFNQYNKLLKAVNYNPTPVQKVRLNTLETKAFENSEFPMPFEKPNPNQTWDEFFKLSEDFLKLTGNIYWYKLMPENGMNAGSPIQIYCLPSHLMEIVLKDKASFLSLESPIDYYKLNYSNENIKFMYDEITHISVNNPNFGTAGEHLYGQSPLRAVWNNILASNMGIDLNLELLRNAGVFGFIHAKDKSLTDGQQKGLKERLQLAKHSKDKLSNIMGASAPLAFTRISLTPTEIELFTNLKYNQKAICNALGWSDVLLNNDDGGKHDKQELELKRVLINTVVPDVKLIEDIFNKEILQKIRGYEDKCIYFNYKELPEMQLDMETMSKWVISLKDGGLVTANEGRNFMGIQPLEDDNMDIITVKDDVMTLEQAILPKDDLTL